MHEHLPMIFRAVMVALGATIMFVCLCRARHMTSRSTRPLIRYSLAAQFVTGLLLVMCATVRPEWMAVALMLSAASIVLQLASTAIFWLGGQPAEYQRTRGGTPAVPISLQSRRLRRWG